MRFRRASWGKSTWPYGWRGWSLALITRKRIINLELHYERKTTNHQGGRPLTHEEDIKRVGACQGLGDCGCSEGVLAGCPCVLDKTCPCKQPIVDRDPGDETDITIVHDGVLHYVLGGEVEHGHLVASLHAPLAVDVLEGWTTPEDGGKNWDTVLVEFGPCVREVDRHPSSQSFVSRVTGWIHLHDRKQQDYGTDQDPFANIREGARQLGLPAWIGCVIRMNDKMRRLNTAAKQYIETGEISLANEGVLDSFDDLGVYSGIGAVVFEEESA